MSLVWWYLERLGEAIQIRSPSLGSKPSTLPPVAADLLVYVVLESVNLFSEVALSRNLSHCLRVGSLGW